MRKWSELRRETRIRRRARDDAAAGSALTSSEFEAWLASDSDGPAATTDDPAAAPAGVSEQGAS